MNDDLRLIASDQTQQLEKLAGDWATAELRGGTTFLERNLADDFVGVGPYGVSCSRRTSGSNGTSPGS